MPWTRARARRPRRHGDGRRSTARATCGAPRAARHQAERRVRRHRASRSDGKRSRRSGTRRSTQRARGRDRHWIVQERIAVRREMFPSLRRRRRSTMRDMLVDFAPYLFRGRIAGFLTRLSATGLANVTSGGGQVPAFVVDDRSVRHRRRLRIGHRDRSVRMITMTSLFGPRRRARARRAQCGRSRASAFSRGERVALIADEASREVAASLARGAGRRRRAAHVRADREVAARPMTAAPPEMLDALEHADAGILCVQPQEGELAARMAIVAVVERRAHPLRAHGRRDARRSCVQGMRADYRLVDRLSQQLCERMRAGAHAARRDAGRHGVHARRSIRRSPGSRPAASSIRATGRTFRPARSSPRRRRWTGRSSATAPPATTSAPSTATCGHAADARDSRRAAGVRPLRARQTWNASSGTTATPTSNSDRVGELAFGTNLALDEMIGDAAAGRKNSRRPPRVRRSLRQPDRRRLEVADARRRPHARSATSGSTRNR